MFSLTEPAIRKGSCSTYATVPRTFLEPCGVKMKTHLKSFSFSSDGEQQGRFARTKFSGYSDELSIISADVNVSKDRLIIGNINQGLLFKRYLTLMHYLFFLFTITSFF